MPTFNSQLIRARALAVADEKETTYGTGVLDANFTAGHNARFDGGAFAQFPVKEYFSDLDLAKGHPWATVRAEIKRTSKFSINNMAMYDYIAGWLGAYCFGKVVTTGAGPFSHLFTADLTTFLSPVTSLLIQDTADIKYKLFDMAINTLKFTGGAIGPVQCDMEAIGSGKHLDSVLAFPALTNPTFIMNNDADILLGPQGAPVSIKERIRSWTVNITANQEDVRHPGSGLFAGFHRRGDMRFSVQMQVAAKDTDDIRTLILGDTIRELQINIATSATATLKFRFPGIVFKGTPGADGSFVAWNLDSGEDGVFKSGANEPIEMTVINSQPTWLTAG
jgi:hypothetical protein